MSREIVNVIEVISLLGAGTGILYSLLCIASALAFLFGQGVGDGPFDFRSGQVRPTLAVSILKPLKGTDPQMYENFRSHCLQNYGEFEIIFGVSEADDPAIALVERLKTEFPQVPVSLRVCRQNLGTNTKVSNLAQMVAQARHEFLVVNDSDIRVGPDYLQHVVQPLADSRTGLVTCLYRGVRSAGLGSRLESLSVGTDFCAGVLAARLIEGGIRFGLGSTLAFRRSDLKAIGGFEALADYLADDYEIGSRIAGLGLKVQLSHEVVETLLPAYTFGEFVDHQLRWARTIRDSRCWGYLGLMFTFSVPWALLALLCSHGARSAWELLALTLGIRLASAVVIGRIVLGDPETVASLWLLPLRDLIAVFVWLGGFIGHTVMWRGVQFRLKNGKLARVRP